MTKPVHPIEKQLNFMLGMVISMVQQNHPKSLEAGQVFSEAVDNVNALTHPNVIYRIQFEAGGFKV